MGGPADRHYPDGVLARLQAAELGMLAAIDRICRDNGITYFVDGGTTLGAVRHGGFIPWDDDIDVAMPIEDFRHFLELAPSELPEGMSVHMMEDTPGFYCMWAKLFLDGTLLLEDDAASSGCREGIFVDIFPYINMDESDDRGAAQLRRTQFWQKLAYIYFLTDATTLNGRRFESLLRMGWRVCHVLARALLSPRFLRRRFERACVSSRPGPYWGNPSAIRPYPYHESALFPPCELDFDGLRVFAPRDCDAYLSELYGDYLRIPAEDERHTHTPTVLDFGDGVNAMEG